MKGEIYNEGKIFCKAYLREMQGYQEKRKRQNYLRESEAQPETGLILLCISVVVTVLPYSGNRCYAAAVGYTWMGVSLTIIYN